MTSRSTSRLVLWILFALFATRLLAVDVFPSITNDGLQYLAHSDDFRGTGLIQAGYRQFGYPLYLAIVDWVGGVVRIEPLLLAAFLQRLLLLVGLVFVTWLWRFWALPLVFVLTTPTLVGYTNFLLTEGLGIPLALLYAGLVGYAISRARMASRSSVVGSAVLAALIFAVLAAVRFHYVVLATGILGIAVAFWRHSRLRKWGIGILAGISVFGVVVFGLISFENHREYGVFFPSVDGERVAYYYTWNLVFEDPDSWETPDIADLYAGGDLYVSTREIESHPSYAERRDLYHSAIDRLVEVSRSSMLELRARSLLGMLVGGRSDDVLRTVKDIATVSPNSLERVIHRNTFAAVHGPDAFSDAYNDGRRIVPVVVSPLAPVRSGPYIATVLVFAIPVAGLVLLAGVAIRRTRLFAVVGLTTLLASSLVLAYYLMDNVRFALATNTFVMAAATGTAAGLWSVWRHRSAGDGTER